MKSHVKIIQDGYAISCYKMEGIEDTYAIEYVNLINNDRNVIYCNSEECSSILDTYNN